MEKGQVRITWRERLLEGENTVWREGLQGVRTVKPGAIGEDSMEKRDSKALRTEEYKF